MSSISSSANLKLRFVLSSFSIVVFVSLSMAFGRRAYYYDRETEDILKSVQHVDGDASQEWDQASTLLVRYMHPVVEVYLKTNLGSMFDSIVQRPPPWTAAFFPELLDRHHRAFEECGAERSLVIHLRNLRDLVRGKRDAVSWREALQLIATVRSIIRRFPNEMPADPEGTVTDHERGEAAKMLMSGKQAIQDHYCLVKDHILSTERDPVEGGHGSWNDRRERHPFDDYGDVHRPMPDRRDRMGNDRHHSDAMDDRLDYSRRMNIRDDIDYGFRDDDRDDVMRRDRRSYDSRYDAMRETDFQERSNFGNRRNDDRNYGFSRDDPYHDERSYRLDHDEGRGYDRRHDYDDSGRGYEWRRDDYGDDYGDRGGRYGNHHSMRRTTSDRYNDGCERRGQAGHRVMDNRDAYDDGEWDRFGPGWNERFARVSGEGRSDRNGPYDRVRNEPRDFRSTDRTETDYRDYDHPHEYRDYRSSGYASGQRGGREGYSGAREGPHLQRFDDHYEGSGGHERSSHDRYPEPLRSDLPRRPPRRSLPHGPSRSGSGDVAVERDINWGNSGDVPRRSMSHEIRRRFDPQSLLDSPPGQRNGPQSDRKSIERREFGTDERRQSFTRRPSKQGHTSFQRQPSKSDSSNTVSDRPQASGWDAAGDGGTGWGRSITNRRRDTKQDVRSEHRPNKHGLKGAESKAPLATSGMGWVMSGVAAEATGGGPSSETTPMNPWTTSDTTAPRSQGGTVTPTSNEASPWPSLNTGNDNPWGTQSVMPSHDNTFEAALKPDTQQNPWITSDVSQPQGHRDSKAEGASMPSPWKTEFDVSMAEHMPMAQSTSEASQTTHQNPWASIQSLPPSQETEVNAPPLTTESGGSASFPVRTPEPLHQNPWLTPKPDQPQDNQGSQDSHDSKTGSLDVPPLWTTVSDVTMPKSIPDVQSSEQNPWLTPLPDQPTSSTSHHSEITTQTSQLPWKTELPQPNAMKPAAIDSWVTSHQSPSDQPLQQESVEPCSSKEGLSVEQQSVDQVNEWVTPGTQGSNMNPAVMPLDSTATQSATNATRMDETLNPWTTATQGPSSSIPEGCPWGTKSEITPPNENASEKLNDIIRTMPMPQTQTIDSINQQGSQMNETVSTENPWTTSNPTGQAQSWTTPSINPSTQHQRNGPAVDGSPWPTQTQPPVPEGHMTPVTSPSSDDTSEVSSRTADIPVPRTSATSSEASPEGQTIRSYTPTPDGLSHELPPGSVVQEGGSIDAPSMREETTEPPMIYTASMVAEMPSATIHIPSNGVEAQASIDGTDHGFKERSEISKFEDKPRGDAQGSEAEMHPWLSRPASPPFRGNPWRDSLPIPPSSSPVPFQTTPWMTPMTDRSLRNSGPTISSWCAREQSLKTGSPIEAPSFNSKQHMDTISGEKFITSSSEHPSSVESTPTSSTKKLRPPPGFEGRSRSGSFKTPSRHNSGTKLDGKAPMEGIEAEGDHTDPPEFFIEEA